MSNGLLRDILSGPNSPRITWGWYWMVCDLDDVDQYKIYWKNPRLRIGTKLVYSSNDIEAALKEFYRIMEADNE